MNTYRVTVLTDDPSRDSFTADGKTHRCVSGEVFVSAENLKDAVGLVPVEVVSVELVGAAFSPLVAVVDVKDLKFRCPRCEHELAFGRDVIDVRTD